MSIADRYHTEVAKAYKEKLKCLVNVRKKITFFEKTSYIHII